MKDFIDIIASIGKKNKSADALMEVLSDQESRLAFTKFCISEYSTENIICYFCIQEYKDKPTKKKLAIIHKTFFSGESSELEVNVQKQELSDVVRYATSSPFPSQLSTCRSITDRPEKSLLMNISDTFTRFIFTPEYHYIAAKKKWKSHKLIIQNLTQLGVLGGVSISLINPLFGIPVTLMGAAVLADKLRKAHNEYQHTKKESSDDLAVIAAWKKIGADKTHPRPLLTWPAATKKILHDLNYGGFDMASVGYPFEREGEPDPY